MTAHRVNFVLGSLLAPLVISQSIYVDRGTNYSALPCCAQLPISIAVRDQSQGCGDGGHLTSYNCFCTTSSSYFSSFISSEVLAQCSNITVASQAISVLDSYCAIGPNGTQATTTRTYFFLCLYRVTGFYDSSKNGFGYCWYLIATVGITSCAGSTLASPARPTTSILLPTSSPTTTGPPLAKTSSKSSGTGMKDIQIFVLGFCMFLIAVT